MGDRHLDNVIVVFGILCTFSLTAYASPAPKDHKLIQNLDTIHSNLQQLSRSIRSAHDDVRTHQETLCQFFAPMSDSMCSLLALDRKISEERQSEQVANGPLSPGKRNVRNTPNVNNREKVLQDLVRKQKFLEDLRGLVDGVQDSVITERKRSCNVNLGFHCQTEQYSAIADMYNWLQSELSPGKRKRDAPNEVSNIGNK